MSKPAELPMLPHTPEIPFDPRIGTYTIFGGFYGKFEPYEYTGWVDECMSWKETCYIGDWSPLSNKFLVKGRDALKFFFGCRRQQSRQVRSRPGQAHDHVQHSR